MNYYLTGPDGSGKTTYLKEIEALLQNRGEQPKHIWIRSPKIFSKPLMAYCRLVGLTKYQYIDGCRYGSHDFYKSKFVSCIFPVLQLLDFKIELLKLRARIDNSSKFILFDRYALDTLADLMVDTHRLDLHKKWIGKRFLKLINEEYHTIILKVDEKNIKSRKLDTRYDPNTALKNKVYSILAHDLELLEICNNRNMDIVMQDIIKGFKLNERF